MNLARPHDEMFTMNVDKQDLICMVKGTDGPHRQTDIFNEYGEITGYPNEKWQWRLYRLETMTIFSLHALYLKLKNFNRE